MPLLLQLSKQAFVLLQQKREHNLRVAEASWPFWTVGIH
jgi:hypothetical protein